MPVRGGQASGPASQVTRSGGAAALSSPDGKYLYYVKEPPPSGLFRMPAEGGEEIRVVAQAVGWGSFGVTAKGVYFVPFPQPGSPCCSLQFLDTASGKVSALPDVPQYGDGLCVSPDDQYVVWARSDQSLGVDLMLVEGFR